LSTQRDPKGKVSKSSKGAPVGGPEPGARAKNRGAENGLARAGGKQNGVPTWIGTVG